MKKAILILAMVCLAMTGQTIMNCTGQGCIIPKTPYEAFLCSMDFAAQTGMDSITVVSVTAVNMSNGTNSTGAVIATSPAPVVSGSKVIYMAQGGNVGEQHRVSIKVQDTTSGTQYEGFQILQIRTQ